MRPIGILFIILFVLFVFYAQARALTVGLAWDPNSETDLAGYKVYHSTVNHQPFNLVGTTAATTYDVTGLSTGTAHYFAITAYNACCESAYSNIVYVLLNNPPTGLRIVVDQLTIQGIEQIIIRAAP